MDHCRLQLDCNVRVVTLLQVAMVDLQFCCGVEYAAHWNRAKQGFFVMCVLKGCTHQLQR